ncbi:MAG: phosphoadenylyl-sulfate reductase [Candidatus Baltobacteraceae bacterium]|jgi:phosphoadenosine phosphosulfate reductase
MPTLITPEARAQRVLDWAVALYCGRLALACSFGSPAGLVLIDLLARSGRRVPVYFLDTGLLFAETYALIDRVRERYGIEVEAVHAELDVAGQAERCGAELWARDPDACCNLRKVVPQRAFLTRFEAWITGIRRDQSATRAETKFVDWDGAASGLAKLCPLADWSEADVWAYVLEHGVPYNPLLDTGYRSIGCVPCTRRVQAGEGPRAGRWPGFAKTECGLHLPLNGAPR